MVHSKVHLGPDTSERTKITHSLAATAISTNKFYLFFKSNAALSIMEKSLHFDLISQGLFPEILCWFQGSCLNRSHTAVFLCLDEDL